MMRFVKIIVYHNVLTPIYHIKTAKAVILVKLWSSKLRPRVSNCIGNTLERRCDA